MKLNSLNGPKSTGNWVWFKETKFAVNILTKLFKQTSSGYTHF